MDFLGILRDSLVLYNFARRNLLGSFLSIYSIQTLPGESKQQSKLQERAKDISMECPKKKKIER